MTLPRADLMELVQFCWPRMPEEPVSCFGPKAQYARKASLKFAKTHRANEGSKVCTEGSYCTSIPSARLGRHYEKDRGTGEGYSYRLRQCM